MSKSKCVPLFDGTARIVLRHLTRSEALEMVGRREAFILAADPLEIALSRKLASKEYDGRPDRSLTVGPSVLSAAVDGVPSCREIVSSYAVNQQGKSQRREDVVKKCEELENVR